MSEPFDGTYPVGDDRRAGGREQQPGAAQEREPVIIDTSAAPGWVEPPVPTAGELAQPMRFTSHGHGPPVVMCPGCERLGDKPRVMALVGCCLHTGQSVHWCGACGTIKTCEESPVMPAIVYRKDGAK